MVASAWAESGDDGAFQGPEEVMSLEEKKASGPGTSWRPGSTGSSSARRAHPMDRGELRYRLEGKKVGTRGWTWQKADQLSELLESSGMSLNLIHHYPQGIQDMAELPQREQRENGP